jgi:hypothetical protein
MHTLPGRTPGIARGLFRTFDLLAHDAGDFRAERPLRMEVNVHLSFDSPRR